MKSIVIAMPGNEKLADELAANLALERISVTVRRFPDEESLVRVEANIDGRQALIVCTLDRPDEKFVPLLLLACAVREAGACKVGLVAPYLAYMRQDRRFHPGETISAQHFAEWISARFDWLVTVDPHLHRISELSQVYSIQTQVVHAADGLARWVQSHVTQPLLIGPDEESSQWVEDVARRAGVPFVVLEKKRRGDRDVEVSMPDFELWRDHTPILIDDIISTARTMIETLGHLRRIGLSNPVCIAVHAVFSQTAFDDLRAAGAAKIVSCDTIVHFSNQIAISPAIATSVREFLNETE
ncbi:MAG: ribose-phosphate pyrophosphokinase [Gammaproteobacteria bacterium]|nr:ribose-phosphate pyrophosphokinase [Gammaproteobacteria bacterium]MBU0786542.1 ribose-phosphate pyrophosphokinase [Gammaproteobacteria bacterium]MBU0817150.1 ribose-phosphate pyrophosphokinase [Gammaproteobacteria bacterium]MBU1787729.1 ribose-phosphate pyrophosphokinase [Gammaproteobacteria bacterium]